MPLRSLQPALLVLSFMMTGAAGAQTVAMTGSMGSRALLVIDGGTPRAVAAGTTINGVKVISVTATDALVEVGGQRRTVQLGASPVSLGGGSGGGSGSRIVLTAGSGGHFSTQGSINGRAVMFMVDTGATAVSMTAAQADAIGLKYRDGQRVNLNTANGVVAAYAVTLSSVRVGDVEVYNVQGIVAPRDMPFVLLGNSFLDRFQMKRENDLLTLDKRF
jgi:aspartyl protease family protein